MKIDVSIVDPIAHFDEAADLLAANWKESGSPIDFIPADVRKFYEFLAANHVFFAVEARAKGVLIGYAVITVAPFPLNHKVLICDCNGIYITPDHRGSSALARLMSEVRIMAKGHGASAIHWHAPAGSQFNEVLSRRFKPLNNYFVEQV